MPNSALVVAGAARRGALGLGLWLALAGANAAGAPQAGVPNAARPPSGTIAGVAVIADSGLPLDGVAVTISGTEIRGTRRVTTNDDGRFAFTELPAGRFLLSATRRGYVSVTYGQREPGGNRPGTPIQLAEGQVVDRIKLAIPKGGVITGQVFDEKGRPSVGTQVRVSRWVMNTGERRLTSEGTSAADDRGMYRVYGLAPGSYIVHAIPRNDVLTPVWVSGGLSELQLNGAPVAGNVTILTSQDNQAEDARVGYAPVYYPGTLDVASAVTVDVGVSQERIGIDLHLQQVPLATVSGVLTIPPGINMTNVRVRLVNVGLNIPGVSTPTARAGPGGEFSFRNVAPGQYRAFAVATARNVPASAVGSALGGEPLPEGNNNIQFWAAADVPVFRGEVSGVALSMRPGMIVSGQVLFDGFNLPRPPDLRSVRLTLTPDSSESGVSSVQARVDANGTFRFVGVVPGRYRIRPSSGAPGWWPKSAMTAGRDTLDFLLDVPENESVSNLLLTLSDRSAEVSGTVEDAFSRPVSELTVILFPSDSRYWLPRSRRIASARPATDGRFIFAGLPAGDYRLAAVTDVEPGGWYDPELLRQLLGVSVAVSLGEGEQRIQSLRVSGR